MVGSEVSTAAELIRCEGVGFVWGANSASPVETIAGLDLVIRTGELVVVVGPSGCGKTTFLKLLAGLVRPTSGRVLFRGAEVTGPSRERGLIFQDLNLFPWLSVARQVGFGLQMSGTDAATRERVVEDMLRDMGLARWRAAYPHQLSGGMQQRVAIARALANDPDVVLMDEPFTALDYQTRLMMQTVLLDVWGRLHKTVVLVTHSIDEAVLLADRVVMLGRRPTRVADELVVQLPRPRDLTTGVVNEYRARLIRFLAQEWGDPAEGG